MKRSSTPLAVAALATLLLPISALRAAPADAIPAAPLINVQCEDITTNSGSLTLGNGGTGNDSTNGLVSDFALGSTVVNVSTAFWDAWAPKSKSVSLDYRPYIGVNPLMKALQGAGLVGQDAASLPEWTVSTRVMMPEYEDSVVLALGANHSGVDAKYRALGALVLATGTLAENRGEDANGDDRTGDELILWYISDGNYGHDEGGHEEGVAITNTVTELGRVKVPCLTDSFHLLTVRYANRRVEVFLNDRLAMAADLPEGEPEIAPGLQYGQLMGGSNISDAFFETHPHFSQVGGDSYLNWSNDGGIDFLLFYNRSLSNEEIYTLARAYPFIHRDEGNHGSWLDSENSYVRYIRRLDTTGYAELDWVSSGAWVRQYTWNGEWWPGLDDEDAVAANRYNEPAEGSIVAIECVGGGTVKLLANTEKGGLFPSADRTYAQLEVLGEGTIKIEPCSAWDSATGDSTTLDPTRASGYRYGTLYFTGSANDVLGLETVAHDATAAGIFRTDAEVSASVCDFSNDIVLLRGGPDVTFVADEARVRGLEGPVVKCRLTKEISGESGNVGTLVTNTTVNQDYAQVSEAVYVPTYDEANDRWLITDKTETNPAGSVVFAKDGLVAWYFNQIEPLYLDLAEAPESATGEVGNDDEHAFSKQTWRRGAYDGTVAAPEEFRHAAHLNVRLVHGKTVSPLIVNEAKRVKSLTLERSEDGAKGDVLLLVSRNGGVLTLSEGLDVDGTLRVYDYDKKVDAVRLLDGTTLTGTGVFAACAMTFSNLKEISVDTIRSEGLLTFGQDVPKTTLAAGGGATLSTDKPNRKAKGLTLNEGSILDCAAATMAAPAFVVSGKVAATKRVRVIAPTNAQHGLVFLKSGEDSANMDSRAAFQAAHGENDRWDIRLDLTETGANYFFDEAGFAEPEAPTDGSAGAENVWEPGLEDSLIDIYQSANYIGGEAEGYTRAKEKVLSASDISDALRCFRNVAALATHGEGMPSTRAAGHSDDSAAVADLLVAYEFGISRATLVKDAEGNGQVLVEVTLRNELATHFNDRVEHIVDPAAFEGTDTTENIETATPAYAEGTTLVFSVNGQEIDAGDVTEEALPAEAAAGASLTRRFRIPLSAFPAGTENAERLEFSVRAVPPEMPPKAQANLLKTLF